MAPVFLSGQVLHYRAAPWEGEIPLERHAYDPTLGTEAGQQYRQTYEFFPTASGTSGERYVSYQRFQLGSTEAVTACREWIIDLPEFSSLEALDYRVWEEGRIVYEAKEARLERDVRLRRNPATGWVEQLRLRLRELAPRRTVEIFYALEGVPLPRVLALAGRLPFAESVVQVDILSAYPLRFDTLGSIDFEKKEIYDHLQYRFSKKELPARVPAQGPQPYAHYRCKLYLDWQELLRRDEVAPRQWSTLLPFLFFKGPLRDYPVFVNSEIIQLSEQIHRAGLTWPPRYFRFRKSDLHNNYLQRWGFYNLSGRYDDLLVELEKEVEMLAARTDVLPPVLRLKEAHRKLADFHQDLQRQQWQAGHYFGDYGLLSKFYFDCFGAEDSLLKPVLFQSPLNQIGPEFLSVRPYQGMGLALRVGKEWQLLLLGPYLGQVYPLNRLPSDFFGGRALIFTQPHQAPLILPIDKDRVEPSALLRSVNLRPMADRKAVWKEEELHLKGNFQNILYYGHLTADSIPYFGFITPFLEKQHAAFQQEKQYFAPRVWAMHEEGRLGLDLAQDQLWPASWNGPFRIPTPYVAEYHFQLAEPSALKLSLERDSAFAMPDSTAFRLDWAATSDTAGKTVWELKLEMPAVWIKRPEQFLAWRQFLEKGLYLCLQDE